MMSLVKYAIIVGVGCSVGIAIGLIAYFSVIKTDSSQCTTADNLPGTCMEVNKCFPDKSSIPGAKQSRPSFNGCGDNASIPMVCCPQGTSDIYIKTVVSPLKSSASSVKISPRNISDHRNYGLLPRICGQSSDEKITGGSITSLFQYPWMAIIMQIINGSLVDACGGTIINELYILTAAHCVTALPRGITLMGVRVGDHNISSEFDCETSGKHIECAPEPQDFLGVEPIPHYQYNPRTRQNDIALIRLESRIELFASTQPICLPTTEIMRTMDLNNQLMTVAGWGLTEFNYTSEILLEADIPIVSNKRCADIYIRTDLIISDKQVCAGGTEGKDTCNGDSGGPLKMLTRNGATLVIVQYGIVSVGPENCGTDGNPGVYTRVSSYMEWILDNMRP